MILDIRLPDIDGYEVARRVRTIDVPMKFHYLPYGKTRAHRSPSGLKWALMIHYQAFRCAGTSLRVRNALKRVSQGSLTNPVSGLPEGPLVEETSFEVIHKSGWALLHISINNLDLSVRHTASSLPMMSCAPSAL